MSLCKSSKLSPSLHTLHHLSTLSTLLWLSPLVINSFASNRSVDLCPFTVPLIDCSIDGRTTAAAYTAYRCMCVCVCVEHSHMAHGQSAYCCRHTCTELPRYFHALATFMAAQKLTTSARQLPLQIYFKHKSQSRGEGEEWEKEPGQVVQLS